MKCKVLSALCLGPGFGDAYPGDVVDVPDYIAKPNIQNGRMAEAEPKPEAEAEPKPEAVKPPKK